MFAERADKIVREFFANIFIAADGAAPYGLAFWGGSDSLWFWFDVVLIVLVGAGG